ncbi:MAG: DUF3488 domain-containing protein, partial [Rhodoferax sp.]|nr:DUF3488 domain-containing protein [Rhodoferax sp.]
LLGREPGATLIVALLTLKTLELRARRDAFVVLFLCFFTMLTTFFFSQSLITAGLMLVGLLGLLTALVNAHLPAGRPPLRQALQVAARMLLLGAPVMAVLFVLFPRMGPLWGLPNDALAGQTGLSENMEVGRLSRLAQDNGIAMRVRFEGQPPPQSSLYFRGPVLSSFDGREWRPLISEFPDPMRPAADLQVRGTPHRYEVTLEPGNGGNWLLLLDASPEGPRAANLRSRLTSELQWQASRPINTLLRYQAESYTDFRHGPQQAMPGLQDYVSLPPGFNPRTLALAASLMAEPALREAGPERRLAAVMQRLREGGYRYTLEPGVSGTHSADEFWFDTKAGFCEHIASAFVILMRALDVPARVVTGYQGGDFNPLDDYLVVRRRDAHAWAEVWLPGRGWTRIDPTTAVAPARVLAPTRAEPAPGAIGAALANVDPAVRVTLRSLWEATNNRWNQWVLNYTQDRQMNLLRGLGFDAPTWQTLSYLLIAVGVLASLVGLGWNAWVARRRDPWLRLLEAAADRLRAWGATVPPNRSPRQLADLTDALPQVPDAQRTRLRDWLLRLEALRYAPSEASRPGLSALARELRALPQRLLLLFAVILIADSSSSTALAGQKRTQKKPVAAAASGPSYVNRTDAQQAADDIAQRIGADAAWVRRVLAQAHYSPTVARLVLPPAVGTPKNWAAYRARFLDEPRIEAGAAFWRSHQAALERAARETGVPARLIVG